MKKNKLIFGILVVLVFVSMVSLVSAQEIEGSPRDGSASAAITVIDVNMWNNIYIFLEKIVRRGNYIIVLGDDAPSMDTLSASEIILGIQQYSNLRTTLPVALASEITNKNNLILIGHPCDNPLIKEVSCSNWPYKKGEALIKISGSNLIIAGTNEEDTRNAARIVANYKDYTELKDKDEIIIKREIDTDEIVLEKQKPKEEMICGDSICDIGEICEKDCKIEKSEEEKVSEENKEIIKEEIQKFEEEKKVSLIKLIWEKILNWFNR